MDNFNIKLICYCKYCNKQCHSKNSLIQHELRCSKNPNRIPLTGHRWKIGERKNIPSGTKGKIVINNGKEHKYIYPEELDNFTKLGWIQGVTNNYKELMKEKSTGIAATPEKELKRKEKISKTMRNNPNSGGYRQGSGRGKRGWYKGIYCDSSWELAFVVYHIDHNLYIERCREKRKYVFENKQHNYYPDFITDDGIIEIKGWKNDKWLEKQKQNTDIKTLYGEEMKPYLEYVINKYGEEFYNVLYE